MHGAEALHASTSGSGGSGRQAVMLRGKPELVTKLTKVMAKFVRQGKAADLRAEPQTYDLGPEAMDILVGHTCT